MPSDDVVAGAREGSATGEWTDGIFTPAPGRPDHGAPAAERLQPRRRPRSPGSRSPERQLHGPGRPGPRLDYDPALRRAQAEDHRRLPHRVPKVGSYYWRVGPSSSTGYAPTGRRPALPRRRPRRSHAIRTKPPTSSTRRVFYRCRPRLGAEDRCGDLRAADRAPTRIPHGRPAELRVSPHALVAADDPEERRVLLAGPPGRRQRQGGPVAGHPLAVPRAWPDQPEPVTRTGAGCGHAVLLRVDPVERASKYIVCLYDDTGPGGVALHHGPHHAGRRRACVPEEAGDYGLARAIDEGASPAVPTVFRPRTRRLHTTTRRPATTGHRSPAPRSRDRPPP